MVELTASDGEIDTSDNLNMFSAFQKVFVINGSNLKVADFINTKLTSDAEISSNVPSHGDILTQDQSGSDYAYMVVDFISSWDSSHHYIYGYAYYGGTATAFDTSNAVKDNDGNTIIAGADLSAVDEASDTPHWYDWTPFNDDSDTYGSMPNKAYLGALYRGRSVLSGNPEHPHQWYMARQNNPWDWAYIANDAQSPVFGNNADAGEIGDIIRALIPYSDDYFIFGGADSIYYLAGDPAAGGEINELSRTTGIFGANSWCFDNEGRLYFWGSNGIYVVTIPEKPECISQVQLPNLINDEDADPTTHRITMAYDRRNVGILTTITKLSNGSNSNWWLDLRSGGLFPESYPNLCGAYSLAYYGANDPDYQGLLIGCKDGYIRKFDYTAKNDDIGPSNTAINSYINFGPISLMKDENLTGKINKLDLITAGGGANGSQSDSNDVTWKIFSGNSAGKVLEKSNANSNPKLSGVFKATGKRPGSKRKQKIKDKYIGIRLSNSTAGETWALEKLILTAQKSGRTK